MLVISTVDCALRVEDLEDFDHVDILIEDVHRKNTWDQQSLDQTIYEAIRDLLHHIHLPK